MDFNNIPLGLNVPTQIPLNIKEYVANEVTLAFLGSGNNLAYTYVDGLRIYCVQEKTIWEWQERGARPANSGLLSAGDFTYPNNIVTFGITYSNKIYNFYKVEYVNKADEKSYDATSLGSGETIYKDKTVTGNNTVFNFKEINTANAGTTGIPVLSGIATAGNDVIISGKRLKTTNLEITETVPGEILIDSPTDPNDIKFYINIYYTGGNSNGSLSKPYVTFKEAHDAYIGPLGTVINPQYSGVGTIELLSNVEIPSSGAATMSYISANNLKVKGNGYSLIYKGNQDYFISTEHLVNFAGAKNPNGTLVNPIKMTFEDLTIVSENAHQIVSHLNYVSPSVPTNQNDSSLIFNNCTIIDNSYLEELGSYTNSGKFLFGSPVFVQNGAVLPKNLYMIKNRNVNWYGEGGLNLINCKLRGSSSTILYNVDSSILIQNLQMDFNSYYVNYKDITGVAPNEVYNPIESVYFILNESINVAIKPNSYIRIDGFKEFSQEGSSGSSFIGGVDALYRGNGTTTLNITDGYFYSEKFNNLIQTNSINASVELNNGDFTKAISIDPTYGAFKYVGTLPVSPIYFYTEGSKINNIKNWTTLQFVRPNANNAIINGAIFSVLEAHADDNAAKIGGLVPGNMYFDTTGQIATRVA